MSHPLLDTDQIQQMPETYLSTIGCAFAIFSEGTQNSGNISYGVQVGQERYFVKTAGRPDDPRPFASHSERVSLLRNSIRLRHSCSHRVLPALHRAIESSTSPLLVYQWVEGELIRADRATRNDPRSTFQRFRRLPVPEILHVLDQIYELHRQLAAFG